VTLLAAGSKTASVWAQPGTLGFLVVFGMGVILFFVFRSMAKQLRKVREAARIEAEQAEARAQAESGGGQSGQAQSGSSVSADMPPIDLSGRAQPSTTNNGSAPRS
jgi:hypothetical protein